MKRIVDLLDEDVKKGKSLQATIIHGNRLDEAVQWKAELAKQYPHVEFSISYFGPVIGTHLGGHWHSFR